MITQCWIAKEKVLWTILAKGLPNQMWNRPETALVYFALKRPKPALLAQPSQTFLKGIVQQILGGVNTMLK